MEHKTFTDTNIIRVLAVAPYAGMSDLLKQEASYFPQIQLDTLVGNLEEGVRLAQENFHANYDIIISRGGTAALLRQRVELPVVEVPIRIIDILQAIRLSDGYFGKRALVGFPSITVSGRDLIELLQLDIDVFTLSEASDITDILAYLKQEGYQTVICDVISGMAAQEAGFDTILITSGAESIRRALTQARQEILSRRNLRDENLFLRSVLAEHSGETVVFRKNGSIYFSTLEEDNPGLISLLKDLLPEVQNGNTNRIMKSLDGYMYTIKASVFQVGERSFVAYYFTRSRAGGINRNAGISFYTKREIQEKNNHSFYRLSGELNTLQPLLKEMTKSSKPLLILGEYGTGRSETAEEYFLHYPKNNQTFIEINCELLNERSRDYLINNQRSPLFFAGNTIHLKNLGFLQDTYVKDLFTLFEHVELCKFNLVIISGNPNHTTVKRYISFIKNKLQCMELELTPLRMNAGRIPAIANLYLSQQNALGKTQVLRIESEAMNLLSGYSWSGNYSQFERILSQLYTTCTDHMIHAEDVTALLRLENPNEHQSSTTFNYLNLKRPLEQIEKEIVQMAVRENNGNQSAAAKQLGISRTTLWRIYKNSE